MEQREEEILRNVTQQIRRWIVEMTTQAGSGHVTSSLSAVELMSVLMFSDCEFFRYDIRNPEFFRNDRLIFSKGHASPLYYVLWAKAGGIDEKELMTFRTFGSRLEGHPTRKFPFTEIPTGSLGQGLGVGVGEALALRLQTENQKHSFEIPRVFVLLGDSELAEGSIWESAALASYYKLKNLVAIVDVNRLGQRGETLDGWDIGSISRKFQAFGWETREIEDGHNLEEIQKAYERTVSSDKPTALIAKTIKGKGVAFLENKNGWHGKALSGEDAKKALEELGGIQNETISLTPPLGEQKDVLEKKEEEKDVQHLPSYEIGQREATRKVYGKALLELAKEHTDLVVLDGEVSNSTYSYEFGEVYPDRFFEMFIAEQNMVSTAVGMTRRGFMPFVSTFGAFFSRAFDQIRMAQYADVNITFVGSHVGVSIGEDGASQMGLEDMAMFRAIQESVILYPSDAVSMHTCVRLASEHEGLTYIRTTRAETPVLYDDGENFSIGGSKTLHRSDEDMATLIVAGVTVSEALKAYEMLREEGIRVRVVDAYSVKPIDHEMIQKVMEETKHIVVVEDHYAQGGLGAAVREAICDRNAHDRENVSFHFLAVRKRPQSGTPEELLHYEKIDAEAIVSTIKEML